jgi:hypothetical protein
MKNLFLFLKQNPRSLYGKVQLKLEPVMGLLLLSAVVAHLYPDNAVSGMGAGGVIGLFVAGFAPWWGQHPDKPLARPGFLHPRVSLVPRIEMSLLLWCAASLAMGYALFDKAAEVAVALQVVGAACGAVVLGPRLPVWKPWPPQGPSEP